MNKTGLYGDGSEWIPSNAIAGDHSLNGLLIGEGVVQASESTPTCSSTRRRLRKGVRGMRRRDSSSAHVILTDPTPVQCHGDEKIPRPAATSSRSVLECRRVSSPDTITSLRFKLPSVFTMGTSSEVKRHSTNRRCTTRCSHYGWQKTSKQLANTIQEHAKHDEISSMYVLVNSPVKRAAARERELTLERMRDTVLPDDTICDDQDELSISSSDDANNNNVVGDDPRTEVEEDLNNNNNIPTIEVNGVKNRKACGRVAPPTGPPASVPIKSVSSTSITMPAKVPKLPKITRTSRKSRCKPHGGACLKPGSSSLLVRHMDVPDDPDSISNKRRQKNIAYLPYREIYSYNPRKWNYGYPINRIQPDKDPGYSHHVTITGLPCTPIMNYNPHTRRDIVP